MFFYKELNDEICYETLAERYFLLYPYYSNIIITKLLLNIHKNVYSVNISSIYTVLAFKSWFNRCNSKGD